MKHQDLLASKDKIKGRLIQLSFGALMVKIFEYSSMFSAIFKVTTLMTPCLFPLASKPLRLQRTEFAPIQSTVDISKSKGPSKHFEISILRHISFVVLGKKQFEQPNFTNDYVI